MASAAQHAIATTELSPDSEFRGQVVEACEEHVNRFRRGEKSKVDAIKSIYAEIFSHSVDTSAGEATEHLENARDATFSRFLDRIEELAHSHTGPASQEYVGQPNRTTKGVPDVEVSDSDDSDKAPDFTNRGHIRRDRGLGTSRPSFIASHAKRARSSSSDPDSEEPRRSTKKPFVEAILPFIANRQSRLTTTQLRPQLQETLRCKRIYSRDVAASKQALVCEPDCPQLPDPIWSDVLLSKFIDLDRIYSALQSIDGDTAETYKVGDLELTAGPSKPKKHVTTAGEWTSAFERYKQGVLFCYPHRERELNDYASYINRQFAAVGNANAIRVIHFDRAVRAEASRGNQFLLTDFHEWNHLYTAFIVTPSTISHSVAARTTNTKNSFNERSNEACHRFNQGRCPNDDRCRYRHLCSLCDSDAHTAPDCPELSDDDSSQDQ